MALCSNTPANPSTHTQAKAHVTDPLQLRAGKLRGGSSQLVPRGHALCSQFKLFAVSLGRRAVLSQRQ